LSSKKIVVAMDGPAGAGKSTVARLVAEALELKLLDTGAMYRCVALACSRAGLAVADVDEVVALCETLNIDFGTHGEVLMNGSDVSTDIRLPEISDLASALSAIPGVRRILGAQQQAFIEAGGYVLEGRDTTSVIAPNAEVKVYLTASIEERAERRFKELKSRGMHVPLEDLAKQIAERDARDMNRADSPLKRVPDALAIETYGMTPQQVAQKIVDHARTLI
jgi:cytidylate kinase